MAVKILEAPDLERIQEDKAVTLLFSYRRQLLEAARDHEWERQIIFDRREAIALIFRQFGGERHQESTKLFETLTTPGDLLKFAPPAKERKSEFHERVFQRPGFYVFGPELDQNQVKSIRAQNRTGLKVGSPIPLSLIELFRVTNDRKPIYLNQPLTDRLQKQLAILIHLRPNLANRLHFLSWEGTLAIIAPYISHALLGTDKNLSPGEDSAIRMLEEFIYHQPELGEIFIGRVTKAYESCVFVEFLPGIEGLVPKSELLEATNVDCRTLFSGGEEMTVEVTDIERPGRIRLSAQSATQKVGAGEKPLFVNFPKQLLLTGDPSMPEKE